ncbi:TPA: hypothetical protein N0F65_013004 [Lagenidium giganteum]|uniref:Uncharacterized protein n=1 Tax=Lagenidium giganteum TaxID=4803 RepID=A0AAV2YKA4_9STRA|nr:TPA: hypothetical protein N0F65_013004 [Lagenidium giganteum]
MLPQLTVRQCQSQWQRMITRPALTKAPQSVDVQHQAAPKTTNCHEVLIGTIQLLQPGDELLFVTPTEENTVLLARGTCLRIDVDAQSWYCTVSEDEDLPIDEDIIPLSKPFTGSQTLLNGRVFAVTAKGGVTTARPSVRAQVQRVARRLRSHSGSFQMPRRLRTLSLSKLSHWPSTINNNNKDSDSSPVAVEACNDVQH